MLGFVIAVTGTIIAFVLLIIFTCMAMSSRREREFEQHWDESSENA